jgi:hypothetical protein
MKLSRDRHADRTEAGKPDAQTRVHGRLHRPRHERSIVSGSDRRHISRSQVVPEAAMRLSGTHEHRSTVTMGSVRAPRARNNAYRFPSNDSKLLTRASVPTTLCNK